ncbi:MAG: osmotically inducible protein OsmC [Chloroflexi bacterium]|nr:osmotically inducible protein OsmC [Chloroflexota bacterium]
MSKSRYGAVINTGAAAFAATPSSALATFRVESRQQLGLRSTVRTRSFTFDVDEPPSLGGTDLAPSPVEYVLAALATCQEITYRLHADALGIPLDGVAVTLEGDIDLRGFFGTDEPIRPGFQAIRGTVTLDSPASVGELERLRDHVDTHCPVFDLLSNPTPLHLELLTPTALPVDAVA